MLTKKNRKSVLELKESFLLMRDKPSLNRKIRSITLYLFHRGQLRFKFKRHQHLLKKLQTCLNEVESRSQRLLIKGYNNVMFCDDINTDLIFSSFSK